MKSQGGYAPQFFAMTEEKILVAGAGGFIGKYVMQELDRRLTRESASKEDAAPKEAASKEVTQKKDAALKEELAPEEDVALKNVVTLGRGEHNDVRADLIREVPEIPGDVITVFHLVGSCFCPDPRGVNVSATRNLLAALDGKQVKNLVYFSSTEVYGRAEGENWSEADIVDPRTPVGYAKQAAEEMVREWCGARGVACTILRLPPVVGTGMKGPLGEMVKRIYRGSYHHIAGNEARISVVHAVDVARACVDLAGKDGVFNLTDGVNPTVHDLAEALSRRLKDKKIMTLSQKRAARWARFNDFIPGAWMNRGELRRMTTSLTFSGDKAIDALGYKPHSVTDYLVNHDYENDPF